MRGIALVVPSKEHEELLKFDGNIGYGICPYKRGIGSKGWHFASTF